MGRASRPRRVSPDYEWVPSCGDRRTKSAVLSVAAPRNQPPQSLAVGICPRFGLNLSMALMWGHVPHVTLVRVHGTFGRHHVKRGNADIAQLMEPCGRESQGSSISQRIR